LLYFELRKWIKNNKNGNIFVYSLYTPYLWALFLLKSHRNKHNIKYCLIVPDLIGKYGIMQPFYTINGIWHRIDSFFIYKLLHQANCFVFLTKHMANTIDIGNKPFTIIEGLITVNKNKCINKPIKQSESKKIILYTGSLLYDFGIETLLKAFVKIHNNNYELWLCGPINESKIVIEYSILDRRIKYLGFLNKEEVIEVQQKATVLINPRPNIGEYVKYSFPSKTMEYLLSGKPVIMYRLDGIPEEYYNFIYTIERYDVESIAQTILSVCEKSEIELLEFGIKARKFIIENKNSIIQTKKIIEMMKKNKN